jgi:hypothetical protein
MVKKMCKSCQKIVKKLSKIYRMFSKSFQKVVKNCQTAGKKLATNSDGGGEAQSYSKAFSRQLCCRPQAKIANLQVEDKTCGRRRRRRRRRRMVANRPGADYIAPGKNGSCFRTAIAAAEDRQIRVSLERRVGT